MQKLQHLKSRKPHLGAPLPYIYIAPYLLQAGIDVEIIDLRIDRQRVLERYLQEKKPVITGLSVMPGSALPRTLQLGQTIKEISPSTTVVWGGAFPSLHQDFCLNLPYVDYVVVGDGEETMPELAEALSNGNPSEAVSCVNGLAYRNDDAIIRTEPRQPVDLDANSIGAWELVEKYIDYYLGPNKYLAINTARGCPHKCTFCYNNLMYRGHKRYRIKSVDTALEEIDYLVDRYGIRKIQFMDDEFLGHRPRGFELVEKMREHHPHLKYHIAARVQDLKKESVVERLAQSGCDSAFIGAETASPQQLEKIQKGMTTTELIEAAKLCRKHSITAIYSFACGFPDETDVDLKATVDMAKVLREVDPQCECLLEIISPVAGTPLFADLEDSSQVPNTDTARWCHFTDWKSAHNKDWIDRPGYCEALQLAFYLAFATAEHAVSLRSPTRLLSTWARHRLTGKLPRVLPEFRFVNFFVKRALWGLKPLRWNSIIKNKTVSESNKSQHTSASTTTH